jgi:hypothetical protein
LALPVEIRLMPNLAAVGSIVVKTRDISTHGFYFNIVEKLAIGTTFEFSIALPIEITGATKAYVSGKARAVRIRKLTQVIPAAWASPPSSKITKSADKIPKSSSCAGRWLSGFIDIYYPVRAKPTCTTFRELL